MSAAHATPLERVLRRDRMVVAAGLVVLTALSWAWLLSGAGMAAAMQAGMSATGVALMLAMWWVMMIAMMTPSAAPFVLLYGRVWRQAAARGQVEGTALPAAFLALGYLASWLAFSIVATALQVALEHAGLLSGTMMSSSSTPLSAALLIAAGAYQLAPLKHACLRHCRGPVDFLARHWRAGRGGAFVMGLEHGAFCVGCCWALMALLFVVGVMSMLWIVLLALFVLVERLAPAGGRIARIAGGALIAWGGALLLIG